jgi:hypothetical protein
MDSLIRRNPKLGNAEITERQCHISGFRNDFFIYLSDSVRGLLCEGHEDLNNVDAGILFSQPVVCGIIQPIKHKIATNLSYCEIPQIQ